VSTTDLSPQEQRFVEAYLADPERNGTKAAVVAGYAERSAHVRASRLLKKAKVAAAIAAREATLSAQLQEKTAITLERLVNEAAFTAFFDPRKLFTAQGDILPVSDWPEEVARGIAHFDVDRRATSAADEGAKDGGDLIQITTSKAKPHDKLRAIELVAKLLGLLKDKQQVEHTGGFVLRWADE
jgi:phage terminase small subunit